MKRFYCAVILLALVFISSFWLNCRIADFTAEFTQVIKESEDPQQIQQYWNENQKYILMLLPHNQTDSISAAVNALPQYKNDSEEHYAVIKAELTSKLKMIEDSLKLNGENIF